MFIHVEKVLLILETHYFTLTVSSTCDNLFLYRSLYLYTISDTQPYIGFAHAIYSVVILALVFYQVVRF